MFARSVVQFFCFSTQTFTPKNYRCLREGLLNFLFGTHTYIRKSVCLVCVFSTPPTVTPKNAGTLAREEQLTFFCFFFFFQNTHFYTSKKSKIISYLVQALLHLKEKTHRHLSRREQLTHPFTTLEIYTYTFTHVIEIHPDIGWE